MAKAGYSIVTGAAVALSAGTAKSVLGVRAPATFGLDLKKFRVRFDGVTATNVPVLVELCAATFATNPPATSSTDLASSVRQLYGRSIVHGVSAARNWTSEPTVLTALDEWLVTPAGGLAVYDIPLGDTPDSAVSEGFVLRLTAPAVVNARAAMQWERA
jgi:hypothetical protein